MLCFYQPAYPRFNRLPIVTRGENVVGWTGPNNISSGP